MFPRFFPHLTISLSQAVRDRTGHVAHAALRRRGFLRAANWKARAQVRWRNVKVSSTFSKVVGFGGRYVPVGRCSAADRAGRRDQTSRPYRGAGGPGARWAPFRTGLRCHFGRCWASATGRQHPRRQPRPEATAFPYSQKEGTYVPFLGCHRARASPYRPTGACGRCPALFSPAAPVKAVERCSTPRSF